MEDKISDFIINELRKKFDNIKISEGDILSYTKFLNNDKYEKLKSDIQELENKINEFREIKTSDKHIIKYIKKKEKEYSEKLYNLYNIFCKQTILIFSNETIDKKIESIIDKKTFGRYQNMVINHPICENRYITCYSDNIIFAYEFNDNDDINAYDLNNYNHINNDDVNELKFGCGVRCYVDIKFRDEFYEIK